MSSSSSSESEDESFNNIRGMKPYMYEPTKSKTNIEYEEISSASECSDDSDVSTTATRMYTQHYVVSMWKMYAHANKCRKFILQNKCLRYAKLDIQV